MEPGRGRLEDLLYLRLGSRVCRRWTAHCNLCGSSIWTGYSAGSRWCWSLPSGAAAGLAPVSSPIVPRLFGIADGQRCWTQFRLPRASMPGLALRRSARWNDGKAWGSELEATSAVANFSLDGPAFGADRHFLLANFLSSGQCSLRLVSRVYDPTERFRGIAHRPARFQPSRGSRTSAECDTRCLGKSLHRCTRPQYAGSDTHRTWLSQAARLRSHGLRAYRTPGIRRTAGGSGSGVRLSSSDRRLARLQTSLQRPGIHYTVDSRDYVLGPVEFISNRRNVILNSPRTGVPKHTAI